jgi:hypothetical protein
MSAPQELGSLYYIASRWGALWLLTLVCSTPVLAAAGSCRDDIGAAEGYKVRSVTVAARWARVPPVDLPLKAGDNYSPATLTEAHRVTLAALKGAEQQIQFAQQGTIAGSYVDSCVTVAPPTECREHTGQAKCVDVTIRPIALRVDLANFSSNLLPIPRSAQPSFFRQIPLPLVLFNPKLVLNQDRAIGTSLGANISTNLLDLPSLLQKGTPKVRDTALRLEAHGKKSAQESFYHVDSELSLTRRRPGKLLDLIGAEFGFDADNQPRSTSRDLRNTMQTGGKIRLRPDGKVIRTITFDTSYRRANDRFQGATGLSSVADVENAFAGRALLDGRVWQGFTRLAVWLDANFPERLPGSYRRMAGVFGYQKEFPVALNQTVGIEATVGAGGAWGQVPEYSRFYGGNSLGNFLYDSPDAAALETLPAGPLLRSMGVGQQALETLTGATRGGTSFWHANFTVSIPVPSWSRPLIPNEQVELEAGNETLKEVLKKAAINSAESFISIDLENHGMPSPEADAKAERIVSREIRPAMEFIADEANLYAVKPIMMFDVARIATPGSTDDGLRLGAGAGIQLTVVIARFEVGYLRALRRAPGDEHGNFVARLVFQNLF